MKEKKDLLSFLISYIIFFVYSFIFFNSIFISIFLSFFLSLIFKNLIFVLLDSREYKNKRILFREFLDIFNSNVISGENFYKSMKNTQKEMYAIFPEEELINKNIKRINLDIDNGKNITEALLNFKYNMQLEDVDIFVDTLIIAIKSGINLSDVTQLSKDMLSENISLDIEISTIIDNSKREFIIMMILPLIVLIMTTVTTQRNTEFIEYIIRIPIFIIFIFSFYLGNKIVNLEV